MTMPASDLHDPEYRDATGVKVKYLYCPECGHFSGGGVCRVCKRGLGEFVPPAPETDSTAAPPGTLTGGASSMNHPEFIKC